MRTFNIYKPAVLALGLALSLSSCERDATETADNAIAALTPAIDKETKNLQVNTKATDAFVKFNFEKNSIVDAADQNWDIALRGTTILVNGGTAIYDPAKDPKDPKDPQQKIKIEQEPARKKGAFGAIQAIKASYADLKKIDATKLKQDADQAYALSPSSDKSWFNEDKTTKIISPIKGSILIIRTHDDKLVKLQMKSYYQDAPAVPTSASKSGFYSFIYQYQPNGTANF
jgi:HmuY protein